MAEDTQRPSRTFVGRPVPPDFVLKGTLEDAQKRAWSRIDEIKKKLPNGKSNGKATRG